MDEKQFLFNLKQDLRESCSSTIKVSNAINAIDYRISSIDPLEKYYKKPFKEWDGETPLCIYNDNTYFFDLDELHDYMEDNDLSLEDIPLMICTPNKLWELDPDEIYADIMPEEQDELADYNKEVIEAFDKLNEFIRSYRPISWGQGPFRTTVEI